MEKKLNINKAFFGIQLFSLSYSSNTKRELKTYNLFDFSRIKFSVASYITASGEFKKQYIRDPLHYCFGDVHHRCEFEFWIARWGGTTGEEKLKDEAEKIDIYDLYVVPNADLLMDIVNRISISSAKKYLSEERKRKRLIK